MRLITFLLLIGASLSFSPAIKAACVDQQGGSAICVTQSEAYSWSQDVSHQMAACYGNTPDFRVLGQYFWPTGNPGYYYISINCSFYTQSYIVASYTEPLPLWSSNNLGSHCPTQGTPPNKCGNPINIATGNKFQAESDFKTSDLLEFTRYYNSDALASTHLLGLQWTNTYTRRIAYSPAANTVATMIRPDGRSIVFNLVGGIWTPAADEVAKLVQITNGSGQLQGWTYKTQDDREIEDFDAKGRLIAVTRSNGKSIVLIYNNGLTENNDNDFQLTSVTAHDGKQLLFLYDTSRRITKITNSDGTEYLYHYDTSGRLDTVTYPGAAVKTYLYNEQAYTGNTNLPNALTGIIDEKSQRYAIYRYTSDGRAIGSEHAGEAGKVVLTYNANGTNTVTHPEGALEQRTFTTILGVPHASAVVSTVGGVNRNSSYTYDSNGRANITTDPLSTTTDYDFDARGLLTQKIESANKAATKRTTQTVWHASYSVPTERSVLNASGVLEAKTKYVYNSRGQVTAMCQIDPLNSVAMNYVCGSSTDAPTGVRQTTTTYCDTLSASCPFIGLVLSSDGPRIGTPADITTYAYYQANGSTYRKGDLWKVTNALNQVTAEYLSYDGAGRVLEMKDINGVITDIEYNPRGWLTARKVRGSDDAGEYDDAITRMEYDATGQATKVIQPDGEFLTLGYDAAHRLTSLSDAVGNTQTYTLNSLGKRTKEESFDNAVALKRTLTRVYDTLGRLQANKNAAEVVTTSVTYDANDNLDQTTDSLSRVTDQDLDPLNRLIKTIQDKGAGKINATTQFEYDARDNLTKVIDPKALNTLYEYTSFNDLKKLTSPDTGITTYTYDEAGNRLSQTDSQTTPVVTSYTYDKLNRLTTMSYANTALNSTYVYDTVNTAICGPTEVFAKGKLTQFTDSSGNTQYCYDRFGNMTRKQQTNNGLIRTTTYEYTLGGRVSRMVYPSGNAVTYNYNAIGRVHDVNATMTGTSTSTLLANRFLYLPFGPLMQVGQYTVKCNPVGGGGAFSAGASAYAAPSSGGEDQGEPIYCPLGTTLQSTRSWIFSRWYRNLNYDITGLQNTTIENNNQGNIVKLTDGYNTIYSYQYDNLDRLTLAKNDTTSQNLFQFSYDATGNRQSKTVGTGAAQTYTYAGTNHRLASVAGTSRNYDNRGNTLQIAANKKFTYDDRSRMVEFKNLAGIVSQYQYNAKGERVRKYKNTTDQARYFYSEGGQLLNEETISGGVTTSTDIVWVEDKPIALLRGGLSYVVESDHLGTPRGVSENVSTAQVWSWPLGSDPFGESFPSQDPDGDSVPFVFNMRLPGQLYDSESGLHYNYFRDYEAATGRYVESDPIGLDGGVSTYGYINGRALNATDRLGLCWSNDQGISHFYLGGGATVTVDEIGCQSQLTAKIEPARNIWKTKMEASAKSRAASMQCGTTSSLSAERSVGVQSGIFWIRGFSLRQKGNCSVSRDCGSSSNGKKMCTTGPDRYAFTCNLSHTIHDLFVNPSDWDNSAGSAHADRWDTYQYGGDPYYLDGIWGDRITGGGTL